MANPFMSDGDSTDVTMNTIVYADNNSTWADYRTAYGHTDYSSDWDVGQVYTDANGWYNVTSSSNVVAYIYDATTGTTIYGSSFQSGLYLDVTHDNLLCVIGLNAGESYSVAVTPDSSTHLYDGDATDLTAAKFIYPEYSGYQTQSGHTDSYEDWDWVSVWTNQNGYFDVTTSTDTFGYLYDATTNSWLGSGADASHVFLDATHQNYLAVVGYTAGTSYTATITQSW